MSDTTIEPTTANRLVAEALGTFLLVFGGVGAAILIADQGEDIAILIGLAICLTLLFGWFAQRNWAARKQRK